jgi:putative acetyltransferase
MTIEAILFDAGGTLIHVDGERFCAAACLAYEPQAFFSAESEAAAAARSWVLRHPGSTDAERLPLFLDRFLAALGIHSEEERRAAAGRVAAEHRRANLWSGAAPNAGRTLGALRERGYRLGVVSNADGRVRRLLEDAGLAEHLEIVLDSALVGLEKPDPRIFLAAAERLGVPPSSCAYVGDLYEIDVVGARAAGLRAILLGNCPSPEPVERVETLPSLLALFPARERPPGQPGRENPARDFRCGPASTPEDIDEARRLFREYEASIGVSLCFQDFDAELAGLPGAYAPPAGALLFARRGSETAGCVALRRLEEGLCEMKRLYVRDAYRGLGIGRSLAEAILDEARRLGYRRMRLDTLPSMRRAIPLYRSLGFRDIPPYTHNPVEGTFYLEKDL